MRRFDPPLRTLSSAITEAAPRARVADAALGRNRRGMVDSRFRSADSPDSTHPLRIPSSANREERTRGAPICRRFHALPGQRPEKWSLRGVIGSGRSALRGLTKAGCSRNSLLLLINLYIYICSDSTPASRDRPGSWSDDRPDGRRRSSIAVAWRTAQHGLLNDSRDPLPARRLCEAVVGHDVPHYWIGGSQPREAREVVCQPHIPKRSEKSRPFRGPPS